MRPVSATRVTQLSAPIEKVFALLTDPRAISQWLPGADDVAATGPLNRGDQINVRFGNRLVVLEVVDCKAPYTFGWVEREGRRGVKTFFRLDWAGGSTAVTVRDVWEPPSVGAWLHGTIGGKRRPDLQIERIMTGLRVALAES